jgi:hypothetical protein
MGVIVQVNKWKSSTKTGRATLVKHPEAPTPQSVFFPIDEAGVQTLGGVTPSFRTSFDQTISKLRSGQGFRNSLLDLNHKNAFDLLLQEVWGPEHAAMSNSNMLTVDALNLTANVHNRKLIELLMRKILVQEKQIDDLRKMIEEKKMKELAGAESET